MTVNQYVCASSAIKMNLNKQLVNAAANGNLSKVKKHPVSNSNEQKLKNEGYRIILKLNNCNKSKLKLLINRFCKQNL